jgi:hypothetical protein
MQDEDNILCGTLETSPGRAALYHHPRTHTEWRAGWDTAHLCNSRIKHVSYLAAYYKYGEVPGNLEDNQKPASNKDGPDDAPWAWVKWRRDASTGVVVGGLPQRGYGLAGKAGLDYTQGNAPGTPLRVPSRAGSVRASSVRSQRSAPPPAALVGPVGARTSSAASSQRQAPVPVKTPRKTAGSLHAVAETEKGDPGSVVSAILSPSLPVRAQSLGPAEVVRSSPRELPPVTEASTEPKSMGLSKLMDAKKATTTTGPTTPRTFRQSGLWRGAWRSSTLRCKNSASTMSTTF